MKLQPKKSLGQHFLNSPHVLDQIISAAHIQKGETVLEIGPGTGVLTAALLNTGANVITVEKDDRAHELIKEKFSKEIVAKRLVLIHGDILDPKVLECQPDLHANESGNNNPNQSPSSLVLPASYSIVANIPYYITGAILEKFLEHEPRPSRMVLLIQKEVAERIVARPPDSKKPNQCEDGSIKIQGKESVLSISVKAFGTPKIIAKVPRGAFIPPPTVDSAILAIENISGVHLQRNYGRSDGMDNRGSTGDTQTAVAIQIRRFFEIVRAGFAHKRKFLIRNLETAIDKEKLGIIWTKLGLDEKVRAEDISTEDWLNILDVKFP